MITGPKPKSAELSEKQGNPGHRPIARAPEGVETIAVDGSSVPDWLEAVGREIWTTYLPKLRAMGYVKETDRLAFARLCDHTARWLRLRAKVDIKGESYTTNSRHGTMERINPDFAIMMRLEEKITSLEDRFGLTPASRQQILARLTEPPPPPDMFRDADATGKRPSPAPSPAGGSPVGMFAATVGAGRPN